MSFNNNPWKDVINALGISAIDHLFNRLDGMYTGKWRSSFHNEAAIANWKNVWAETLWDRGITLQKAKRGLENCIELYSWPPSLSEFIKACEMSSKHEQAPSTVVALPNNVKPKPISAFRNELSALKAQLIANKARQGAIAA